MDPAKPAVAETHISWVILTGDRAYKVPKPVVTDVVDQGDPERRWATCEREVELNARLSPDVYLGVGSISLDGDDLEPVIVMRRLPDDKRLSALLDHPDAEDLVRDVARTIAAFHESAEVLRGEGATRVASPEALMRRWRDDLAGLRDVAEPAHADRVDLIERRAVDYLSGRERLLVDRIDEGLVRDGHGDLLADDIFCLDDGPRILDCLAFSDDLRRGDVMADLAFLLMDLQRLGAADAAGMLLRAYCEFSDEHHPASLTHLYAAQRALVRAKVTALRHRQEDDPDSQDVADLIDLAADHLDRAAVRVVLVGGLPGSGKSTVAGRMADEFGWGVLASDEVRRDLGLRYEDLHSSAAYDAATVGRVYDEMRRRADQMMRRGLSAVLDATWTSESQRAATRALAREAHAEIVEVRCTAPLSVCRDRVADRDESSHSEATPDVVDVLADRADPWPEAARIDTDASEPAGVSDAVPAPTGPAWGS